MVFSRILYLKHVHYAQESSATPSIVKHLRVQAENILKTRIVWLKTSVYMHTVSLMMLLFFYFCFATGYICKCQEENNIGINFLSSDSESVTINLLKLYLLWFVLTKDSDLISNLPVFMIIFNSSIVLQWKASLWMVITKFVLCIIHV